MRGFIHVVEIIIISIVMFYVLIQFTTMPSMDTDWERTKLYLMTSDLVHVMDDKGVDWTSWDDINATLEELRYSGLLSDNLLYDVKIKSSSGAVTTVVYNEINEPVIVSFYETINKMDSVDFREIIFSAGYVF